MATVERMQKKGKVVLCAIRFLIAAYLLTGLLLALLAFLLYRFHISDTVVSIGVNVCYVLSTFLTGLLAGKIMKNKKYLWGLCLGGLYFLILVFLSFLLKGEAAKMTYHIWTTMFICIGSGMLGGMLA